MKFLSLAVSFATVCIATPLIFSPNYYSGFSPSDITQQVPSHGGKRYSYLAIDTTLLTEGDTQYEDANDDVRDIYGRRK
jgi:hypothetical protein